ncbi:acyl-CoA carboxylase subunit epsilon (plasmid) [Coraliomargarita sp. W4R53]
MTEPESMDADGLTIDVQRGTPTAEELAALIAVVSEAYTSEAAAAVVDDVTARSAWSLSQRGLREPLRRQWGWPRG